MAPNAPSLVAIDEQSARDVDSDAPPSKNLLPTARHEELKSHPDSQERGLAERTEQPKIALKQGRWPAAVYCLVHVPSIVISAGVLSLTFRSVFWQAPGANTNTVLNALQFAVKVHEGLIVLSLCVILTSYIQFALIGSFGIPLGLLSSGFQINSVGYLFGKEFWSGATAKGAGKHRQLSLVFVILFMFLLAGITAPSSAIAILPRLGWWPVPKLWPEGTIAFSAYIQGSDVTLFPDTVTRDHLPGYCFEADAVSHNECPSSGLLTIIETNQFLKNRNSSYWIDGSFPALNITMPSAGGDVLRFLGGTSLDMYQGNDSVYAAVSIPDFLANTVHNYYDTILDWHVQTPEGLNKWSPLRNSIERPLLRISLGTEGQVRLPRKPAVQVQCSGNSFGVSELVFPHEFFMTYPWNGQVYRNANWSIPTSEISDIAVDNVAGKVNFTWVDVVSDQDHKPSLAGVFAMPQFAPEKRNYNSLYACSIAANWMPTKPWIDPATDKFLHEDLSQIFTDIVETITGTGEIATYLPLYIDRAWAEALSVDVDIAGTSQNAMEMIGSACATSVGNAVANSSSLMSITMCLEMALALYITDGLSRYQSPLSTYFLALGPGQTEYNDAGDVITTPEIQDLQISSQPFGYPTNLYPNITTSDLQDTTKYTRLNIEVLQYGYGYGLSGSLIYLAVVVLLLHILIAVIHTVFIITRGVSSHSWSSIGEMITLALNSEVPHELRNTGAGVDRKETWQLMTRIRELDDDNNRIGLVFDRAAVVRDREVSDESGHEKYPRLRLGRKYG